MKSAKPRTTKKASARPSATLRKAAVPSAASKKKPVAKSKPRPASKKPAAVRSGRKTAPATKPVPRREKPRLPIPPILLEGDVEAAPPVSGPGHRYDLGPVPLASRPEATPAEVLPESYETERLSLSARDSHWLYAHWDISRERQQKYRSRSVDGNVVLRICKSAAAGSPLQEVGLTGDACHWFVHVDEAGTAYRAETGYYDKAGNWVRAAASGSTLTPPETLAAPAEVRFESIPVDVPFKTLLTQVQAAIQEHPSVAKAVEQVQVQEPPPAKAPPPRTEPQPKVAAPALPEPPATPPMALPRPASPPQTKKAAPPPPAPVRPKKWTRAQERALAEIVRLDSEHRLWIGSLEITELIRRKLEGGISSPAAAGAPPPGPASAQPVPAGAPEEIASPAVPFGAAPPPGKGFWFNVNAELILYGATEPDARLTLDGRRVKLRSDGTFSFRFALPDGIFPLRLEARSRDGSDGRRAELSFSRATRYRGVVAEHPQDPRLKIPRAESVV